MDPHELHDRIGEASAERDERRRMLEARLERLPEKRIDAHGPEERYLEELRALGYIE